MEMSSRRKALLLTVPIFYVLMLLLGAKGCQAQTHVVVHEGETLNGALARAFSRHHRARQQYPDAREVRRDREALPPIREVEERDDDDREVRSRTEARARVNSYCLYWTRSVQGALRCVDAEVGHSRETISRRRRTTVSRRYYP